MNCFLWEAHLQKTLYLSWKYHRQASSAARTPVPGSRTAHLPPPAPGGYAPGNPWQTILSLPGSQRGWELLKGATDSLLRGITALHKGGGHRVQRKWTGDRYPCQSSCLARVANGTEQPAQSHASQSLRPTKDLKPAINGVLSRPTSCH